MYVFMSSTGCSVSPDQTQNAWTVLFSYLLPHSPVNRDSSVYAKVASRALDCPFESISLPLLSCRRLRQPAASLHGANLRLSSTIGEGLTHFTTHYLLFPCRGIRKDINSEAKEVEKNSWEIMAQNSVLLVVFVLGKAWSSSVCVALQLI